MIAGSGSGSHDGRSTDGCSSCLPFCFWGSRVPAQTERRRRRRCRLRLRLKLSESWFSWPWLRKRRGGTNSEAAGKNKGKSRRKLLLLLLRSLQAKKELASVSSGSSFLAKVSSFGGAKKRNRSKPRQTVDDDAAPTTSCAEETAPSQVVTTSQRFPRSADGIWRAPSSRFHSLQLNRGGVGPCPGGMWTAATTLGVIVFLGRITAMFFLCSCMYGARWWFEVARTETKGGTPGGGSSRRLGHRVALDYLCADEHKKKIAMYGLLDTAGSKRPSSRFCIY
ncbi:uncharacterized protein [Lolium perenne]|uniref:uncharacterized protein n=1 Tax=Lolium perenne TaxID=4522 RepID=UPI0021EADB56|nr:uncharacterized protein LOC127292573 [Lolium perenne]